MDGQHRLPPVRGEFPRRCQQRQHHGHAPGQCTPHGLHRGPIGLEVAGGLVVREGDLARAVGQCHGGEHRGEHDDEADDEQDAGGDPLGPHHACETELVEPQHLGPGAREEEEDRGQRGEDRQGPGQWAGTPPASFASGHGTRGSARTGRAPLTGAAPSLRPPGAEGGGPAEEEGGGVEAVQRAIILAPIPAILAGAAGGSVGGLVKPLGGAAGVIALEEAAANAVLATGRGGLLERGVLALVVGLVVGPGAHGHAPCRCGECAIERACGLRRRNAGRNHRPTGPTGLTKPGLPRAGRAGRH